jgi:hypothetical protein
MVRAALFSFHISHYYPAEEFSPDRFLDDRLKKYLLNNPFQFLPSVVLTLRYPSLTDV